MFLKRVLCLSGTIFLSVKSLKNTDFEFESQENMLLRPCFFLLNKLIKIYIENIEAKEFDFA
jgi:hypothetical protein